MKSAYRFLPLLFFLILTGCSWFDWEDLNADDGPDDEDSDVPMVISAFNTEHWTQCVKNQAYYTGWPEGIDDYCYQDPASSGKAIVYWCTSGFEEMIRSALHECCSQNRGQFYEVHLLKNSSPVGCWHDEEPDPQKRLMKGEAESDCLNEGSTVVYQRPTSYVSDDYGICQDPNPPAASGSSTSPTQKVTQK